MGQELKIGAWRFRPELHELDGPDGHVQLEPRTADVLHDLARHAGQVRTRDEILSSVWGDAFVGEGVLTHCIWQLRKCFDDDARNPRYIRTVPGRGYQLIATTVRQRAPAVRTLVAVEPFAEVSVASQIAAATGAVDGDPRAALLTTHHGVQVSSDDGPLLAFERPIQAVRFALALAAAPEPDGAMPAIGRRIGIHMDEVRIRSVTSIDQAEMAMLEVEGGATAMATRLCALASPGQTLLTRGAFDVARRAADEAEMPGTAWVAHGPYQLPGVDEPVGLFEVGIAGGAALMPPRDSAAGRRGLTDGSITGWRPAQGQTLPGRPQWQLQERLGEGGFGEVWLAQHLKTGERRVLKFCYDLARLRALQREVTIFRLIKEELGDRPDIGRILDWNFDTPPYFLELEHSESGSLLAWADAQGGIDAVPRRERLRLIAEVAEALAVSHSVGVLHKDIKPSNVLIYTDAQGQPRPRLTDFGIGRLTDRQRLARAGVTALGMTATAVTAPGGTESGTHLYMAPELVEGRAATVQADIYSLGVVLYQMVVGDFGRALAPGWERAIDDELLRDDIAAAVDGAAERRLPSARALAERLASHETRRAARIEAEQLAVQRVRDRNRRRWSLLIAGALAILVTVLGIANLRVRHEADRANQEAYAARQVASFLGDLFRDAEPGEELGRTYTARQLLDLGARKANEALSDQPLIRAELLTIIGSAYRRLGLHDEATKALDTGLALRRHHLGPTHLDVAESLHEVGLLLTARGQFSAAADHHRESLGVRRAQLPEAHPLIAQSLGRLAGVRRTRGAPEAAEPLYRQALDIHRSVFGDESLEVASSLSDLALCLRAQGDLDGAEPLYRRALTLRQQLLGPRHLRVATSLNNLAGLLRTRGDAAGAVPLLREALAIRREHLDESHPEIATSFNNLGRALRSSGALDEARQALNHALDLRRRMLEADHPRIGQTLLYLAEVHLDADQPEEAERDARAALAIFGRSLAPDHWRIDYAENVLGGALAELGRDDEAQALLESTVEILRGARGTHSAVAREAQARLDAFYASRARRR